MRAADAVITMGCGDACPIYPGKRYEDWELDDPADADLDGVRRIRDEIAERVRRLLDELVKGEEPTSGFEPLTLGHDGHTSRGPAKGRRRELAFPAPPCVHRARLASGCRACGTYERAVPRRSSG